MQWTACLDQSLLDNFVSFLVPKIYPLISLCHADDVDDHVVNMDEEDMQAIASLADAPPPSKAHSYRHHLRPHASRRRPPHARKHSLDESRFPIIDDAAYLDSDDDLFPYAAVSSLRLDQTLASSSSSSPPQPLPEFIAAGGDSKNFKVPMRAAVHPNRPPCFEIRPHPLRETQAGKFLRTFACTDTQLWAGQESGIRVWNLSHAYQIGNAVGSCRVRRGDEEAAPFYESVHTSPTLRVMVDSANRLVWTGHRDGRIKSWRMDQPMDDLPFREGLSWQAHRSPILAMTITSYGDIWTGSEGGAIRLWPWEPIEKSLRMSSGERHMAALLVERTCVDLRSQVTLNNGVCILSSSDVKFLLSDTIKAKVWCASSSSFSLWDARTRELLKVFNVDGQIENRVDLSLVQEQAGDDEMKVKFVSSSKKEKSQGPSFLQRSRNALMGAADVVRRVATKGAAAFVEDKRTEALVQSNDGMIWTGCSNGLLVQWDGDGNRLKDYNHHACAIHCLCALGTWIYVGYVSGVIQILDLEGNMKAGWRAHNNPILKLAVGDNFVFSLAAHGGLRGWSIISPGPLDNLIRTELAKKEAVYTRQESFRIVVGTWNVGQGRAPYDEIMSWIGSHVSDVSIVVVGLQEVEMGAGFLAMSAAKETVGLEGSAGGQWWQDAIGKALDEGSIFERIGSRQLAGLLITMWVRRDLRKHVGDIDAGAVPCGFGRAIGNKGAVGLRIRVYDRIICFVNCHFAAHLEAVSRRNADFDHVYRNMVFNRSNLQSVTAVGVSSSAQLLGSKAVGKNPEDVKPELSEADMIVFLGDLNYRLNNISYDESRDFVSQRCFDWLREKDQLREEMKGGRVFQGMREAVVRFPPTYKFERHQAGLGGYDCGEKKRIPAWCDRILFRDTQTERASECSLECPVVASVIEYEGCMDVNESDHKPVRCKMKIEVARVDRRVRRREFGEIIRGNPRVRGMVNEMSTVPAAALSTDLIILHNHEQAAFHITNKCARDFLVFHILCEAQVVFKNQGDEHRVRAAFAFPPWLHVLPAGGIIEPEHVAEVSVRHVELQDGSEAGGGVPRTWWNEDTHDKEVVLAVRVQGSLSSTTQTHTLRVHLPHNHHQLQNVQCPPPSGRVF